MYFFQLSMFAFSGILLNIPLVIYISCFLLVLIPFELRLAQFNICSKRFSDISYFGYLYYSYNNNNNNNNYVFVIFSILILCLLSFENKISSMYFLEKINLRKSYFIGSIILAFAYLKVYLFRSNDDLIQFSRLFLSVNICSFLIIRICNTYQDESCEEKTIIKKYYKQQKEKYVYFKAVVFYISLNLLLLFVV